MKTVLLEKLKGLFIKYWLLSLAVLLLLSIVVWSVWASQSSSKTDKAETLSSSEDNKVTEKTEGQQEVAGPDEDTVQSHSNNVATGPTAVSGATSVPNSSSSTVIDETVPEPNPVPETEPDPLPESPSAFVALYADNQSDSDEDDVRHQNVVNRILASGGESGYSRR